MDIFKVGDRVAIDLNLDAVKKDQEIHMGRVIELRQDERRLPGTLVHPMLIVVKGDDGEEYSSIRYGGGLSPFNFTTARTLAAYIEHRQKEVLKELDILKELEDQFTDEMSYRAINNMDYKAIKSNFGKTISPFVKYIKNCSDALSYLRDTVYPMFFDDDD